MTTSNFEGTWAAYSSIVGNDNSLDDYYGDECEWSGIHGNICTELKNNGIIESEWNGRRE